MLLHKKFFTNVTGESMLLRICFAKMQILLKSRLLRLFSLFFIVDFYQLLYLNPLHSAVQKNPVKALCHMYR
jgi:hypothetical protein